MTHLNIALGKASDLKKDMRRCPVAANRHFQEWRSLRTPMRLHGLAPVVDARTKVVILGSFPSAKSLASGQYYGNPQNQFWRLMSAVLAVDLVGMEYTERLSTLLQHGIGLWDVFESCERTGSLDAAITGEVVNDLHALSLECVYFNGKKAYSYAGRLGLAVPTHLLPSSSTANAMRFEDKIQKWRKISETF